MGLLRFIAKRLLMLVPVLIGVTFLTFIISHVVVKDPARAWAGLKAKPETVAGIRAKYHLDDPIIIQYFYYMRDLATGDWGISPFNGQPVLNNIKTFFPATLELAVFAMLMTIAIGIPLGVLSAKHRDKPLDHLSRLLSLSAVSTPPFLAALLLQLIVFYYLGWLPASGRIAHDVAPPATITGLFILDSILTGNWTTLLSSLRHIILPATSLALLTFGVAARITRSSMLEVLGSDYIRTARAKGLPENMVIYKHALRNALIPTTTVLAVAFGFMLCGTIVIETIFNWPGIGRYATLAVLNVDFPAIMGTTVMYTLSIVISNLIADVTYAFLDPRIRLE
ncbi:MAG: ABC transporter permease [Candidatus Bathyarchaeia archaeon]